MREGMHSLFFGTTATAEAYDEWFPWTDNSTTMRGSGLYVYPQPVLCDIVFDADGSLIMSFFDRTGHQGGWNNYTPDGTSLTATVIGGDLLRAYFNPATCTYELESNGKEGPSSTKPATGGVGNSEGPNGGEFYFRDCFDCTGGGLHRETTQGGIAMALGSGEVAVAVIDPDTYDSGGLTWYNNTSGVDTKDFRLYFTGNTGMMPASGTFSKANGLGDVEVSLQAAPLEIGNRVWNDTDGDGIQDAGEAGIESVAIELYADFDNNGTPDGAALATTNTATDGTWYFNASNVTDGDPGTSGNQAGPQPQKRYLIRVGSADWTGGVGVAQLANLFLTTSNVGGAGQPDVRDNDATLSFSIPTISYLTGKSGQNDHTLDMGFKVASCALTSAGETLETCNDNGTPSNASDDYITFSLNPVGTTLGATYSVTANNGGTVTLAGGGAATAVAYGAATSFRLQTGSANNTLYTITVTDAGGAPCTATTTVQQTSCSPDCSLISEGKTLETCNDNGSVSNPADDYITFSLNPVGTNLGATYSVTANNGGTVTLAGGGAATAVAYGAATSFRLQTGSANNTSYIITVTDVSGAPCTATSVVRQMSCSSTCSLSNLTESNRSPCDNNGTVGAGNDGDDWVTADITLAFSNPPATGNLVLSGDVRTGGGALSVPVASIGAGPTYTFVGVRLVADGTPITVTATFDAAPSCTVTNSTLMSQPRCSNCPDIPCGDTDYTKN